MSGPPSISETCSSVLKFPKFTYFTQELLKRKYTSFDFQLFQPWLQAGDVKDYHFNL